MNPQSTSHNYRKTTQKSGLRPLNYATVAPELIYFYSNGLVCYGVIPDMLNQSHTILNLQQCLLSQIQKVVLLSTCSIIRKILNVEVHYQVLSFIHPFQYFLMQSQQIVGSNPLLWELYNTGHSPRIPNNSNNEEEEGDVKNLRRLRK
jgi:hypothetical protein